MEHGTGERLATERVCAERMLRLVGGRPDVGTDRSGASPSQAELGAALIDGERPAQRRPWCRAPSHSLGDRECAGPAHHLDLREVALDAVGVDEGESKGSARLSVGVEGGRTEPARLVDITPGAH